VKLDACNRLIYNKQGWIIQCAGAGAHEAAPHQRHHHQADVKIAWA